MTADRDEDHIHRVPVDEIDAITPPQWVSKQNDEKRATALAALMAMIVLWEGEDFLGDGAFCAAMLRGWIEENYG